METEENFTDEMQTTWAGLAPHSKKDRLLLVSNELELKTVAQEMAADRVETIGQWLQQEKLIKPTKEKIATWESSEGLEFRFIIVQPWVLVKELKQS